MGCDVILDYRAKSTTVVQQPLIQGAGCGVQQPGGDLKSRQNFRIEFRMAAIWTAGYGYGYGYGCDMDI